MKKYLNATRISMLLALAIIGVFSVVNAGQIKSALFEQLTTITFDTAKQQLDIAETQIVENLYHRTTLLDINGLFMLAMNKRIIGNMEYYKDSNNVVHRLESTPPPPFQINPFRLITC
ncbi:MAG: hypothetical protein LBS62_06540 [Clostridiales bacterium]|jgi:hypothetical protein|nr:hypothetical protein [Clostridiales bacterium]